jgi:hypothetical protein
LLTLKQYAKDDDGESGNDSPGKEANLPPKLPSSVLVSLYTLTAEQVFFLRR